jgi:hypothetical protein
MNKKDIIARRILGWKLNSAGKWFDIEKNLYIADAEFLPEQNLDDAMLIIAKLEQFGFTYTTKGATEVCFNEICAHGDTIPQAITNAAYSLAEITPISDDWF